MMRKQKMKSVTSYFVAAVFLACYLAETAECSRRRKSLRIDVPKEADSTEPVGVYEGEILFGKSLKGPESQLLDGTNQPSSNSSVEDEAGFQADAPVFPYDQAHMDAWNQMTKSLQCGADQMDFKATGSGLQHFAVNQLNGPSLPLPLVPPSCGYNMRRLPFFLRLSIPYSGCHMLKEGGHYMLPLTWRGIPVVLSCQTPRTHFSNWAPWHHTHPIPPFPPVWPPWHPLAGETPTSQPTAAPQGLVAWPMDPWPVGQHPGVQPWHPWNVKPAVPVAPPVMPHNPLPWPDHPAILPAPTAMPQIPLPHPFPWYHNHPYYHKHPYYNYAYYHKHPHYHPYWLHAQVPTPDSPPVTTMMPFVPVPFPPYGPGQRKVFPNPTKS